MANLGKTFDPNAQEPSVIGGSQLPVSDKTGWPMVITASEMKETQAKDGQGYLEISIQIIDGEHRGEEGKMRFNLFNKNEQAVSIAERQLTALAYCVGIYQPFADSAILHNRPFRGVVGLQKDAEAAAKGYTEIKGTLDINGNPPAKQGAVATPAPVQPVAPAPVQATAPAATWNAPAATPEPAQPAQPAWSAAPAAALSTPPWQQK
jgi:hypothetical protein